MMAEAKEAQFFNFNDFEAEGAQIVKDANAQAKAIIDKANAQRDAVLEEAKQAGHKEGMQAGLKEGRETGEQLGAKKAQEAAAPQFETAAAALTQSAEQVDAVLEQIVQHVQSDFVMLARAVAEAVIRKTLEGDPELVARTLNGIIDTVMEANHLTVKINPQDEATVKTWFETQPDLLNKYKHLNIVADESITAGGCILETPEGGSNGTIESQVEALVEALGQ